MSTFDDIADSTDWLSTPLAGLAPLESGLRCQVCKDFFTTPMMTSCSHTFCSLCIRRYLSQEGKCPACRETDQEMKLRRNWTVEELVNNFMRSRDAMLVFARQAATTTANDKESGRPKKRRKVEPSSNEPERRSTRSQSRKSIAQTTQANEEPISTQEEVMDSEDEGSIYQDERAPKSQPQSNSKEPNDGLVACPNCSRRMKETAINAHLDRCLAGLPTSPEPATKTQQQVVSLPLTQRTKSPVSVSAQDRLPSINYALFTEASLKKKLIALGIPNHGNKELMRKRHTEWMNLWNANCDSSRPKSKRELLRELDTWERTLGRQIERSTTGNPAGIMNKDFDRDGWAKSHTSDFGDLIKKAREKRSTATEQSEENSKEQSSKSEDTEMKDASVNGGAESALPSNRGGLLPVSDGMMRTDEEVSVPQTENPGSASASKQSYAEPLANGDAFVDGVPQTTQKAKLSVSGNMTERPAEGTTNQNGSAVPIQNPGTPGGRSKFFG